MRAISRARFEAMVSYCRKPLARHYMQELAWFEAGGEQVLGTLVFDTDGEYSGMIMGRDRNERFRAISSTSFLGTPEQAIYELHVKMDQALAELEITRDQGDETGKPVDFFTPVVRQERLSRGFQTIESNPGFSPARGIVCEMMRWHQDVDGNFIEQFQTTGFDSRIWELYLFAALVESDLEVTQPSPAPDFLCSGPGGGKLLIEATTVNPTIGKDGRPVEAPRPETDDDLVQYVQHYLPIKYAGPLTTKLMKKYWEKPAAIDKPLVFAIQDFHDVMSMSRSKAGLGTYLYGYVYDAKGNPKKITEHVWGGKKILSGFFSQPGAEHVSAVIFNASATLSKFNRMGVAAGFGDRNVVLIRRGHEYNPDPGASAPRPYQHIVGEGYCETWVEGMEVYHNPRALRPLDPELLRGAVHNYLLNSGQVCSEIPGWAPLNSITSVLTLPNTES